LAGLFETGDGFDARPQAERLLVRPLSRSHTADKQKIIPAAAQLWLPPSGATRQHLCQRNAHPAPIHLRKPPLEIESDRANHRCL
jgi:hypothetical protein